MSSRRILKKEINASFEMLYTDCILYTLSAKEPKSDAVEKVIDHICDAQTELLSRVSAVEGKELKTRIKAFFKKIETDLKTQVNTIGKEIQNLD